MNTSFSASTNSSPITDLKVTIQDSDIILPSHKHHDTYSSPYFLSNIDQVVYYYVRTVHFFNANKSFECNSAIRALKRAVGESLLGPFHFLVGKVKQNADHNRLEIDLNETVGIEFLVAKSEFALDEIDDLSFPHPAFKEQLVISYPTREDESPLVGFQVTKFKCGGFCIGVTFNHVAFDGFGYRVYLQYLADLAANRSPVIAPFTDRHLLAARRSLQVTFPHIEIDLYNQNSPNIDAFDLDVRVFKITSPDINKLKRKALEQVHTEGNVDFGKSSEYNMISGFSVVTALIWICKALSNPKTLQNPKRLSTIFFVKDIRSVLNPPLPEGYVGNAFTSALATSACNELNMSCFGKVVNKLMEGGMIINDEYVRSSFDLLELRRGFPVGECLVSSCCKLGYQNVEYPWGKSKYTWAVDFDRKDPIMLFPEVRIDDEELGRKYHEGQGVCCKQDTKMTQGFVIKLSDVFGSYCSHYIGVNR